ncbi:acetyltransferase [Nemania sp. FL0916]|nr:acetyltransferase [Nemania sp. FL0916]
MTTESNNTQASATSASNPADTALKHAIPETTILQGKRCILRPYKVSDAEDMVEPNNDPEVIRYFRTGFPIPYTLDAAHWWVAHCIPGPTLSFAILSLEGEYAGSITLKAPTGCVDYAGTRELGYLLARKFWGRGFMTEATQLVARWAFATLPDLLRIEASVLHENEASRRVLQKAGFVEEGTRRLAAVKNGKPYDEVIFGLLRTDLEA